MQKIKIFAMTHRKFEVPKDPMYIPLQVGREGKEDLGYLSDNTGSNISAKNRYFSELTGVYWVLKNVKDAEYLGVCHYRRYPVNEKELVLTEREYLKIFRDYDTVTSKLIELRVPYYDGFGADHHMEDLLALEEVLREKYPVYYEEFEKLVHENRTYFGNIMVAKKEVFQAYHEWLFCVLFELEKKIQYRLDGAEYDDYHRRVYGFLSEFLMYVWIKVNNIRTYETKIGIIGEKAETGEMKRRLAAYLENRDVAGAKAYFLSEWKKRPDLLMEVSDITGELKLTMQIIATCDLELEREGRCHLDRERDYRRLLDYYSRLNRIVEHYRTGKNTGEDLIELQGLKPERTAVETACRILCGGDYDRILEALLLEIQKNH